MHMYFCINYALQATLKNHFCVKNVKRNYYSVCIILLISCVDVIVFFSKSKANKGILNVIDSFTRYLKYTKNFA